VAPEFNGQAMVDKVLSELAASGGPFVLIIDDLHELSSGYGENAWAGVKAHLDTRHRARPSVKVDIVPALVLGPVRRA